MRMSLIYRIIAFWSTLLAFFCIEIFSQSEAAVPDFTIKSDKVLLVIIKPSEIVDEYGSATEVFKTMYLKPGIVTVVPGLKTNISNNFKAGSIHYLLDSKDAVSQKYLGDALYKMGNKAGATKAYRAALKLDPNIKGVYRNYSVLLAETGNPDQVLKILNTVIKKGEDDVNTYLALGKIYQRKNNHPKAIKAFQKILKDNPNDYSTLHALAVSKEKSGKIDGAITDLKKSISLNKNASAEYEMLGRLYDKQKNTDDAMLAYKNFLDNKGKKQSIALKVGTYFYGKGKLKAAENYLKMVKGKRSKTSKYSSMMGNCAFSDGNYKEAIALFKLTNARKPTLTIRKDSYKKLAESYLKLNNNKNALFWFEKFSVLNKGKNKDISYLKAFLYEKSNPAKAKQLYGSNIKIFPNDHRNYLRLGLILSKNKNNLSRSVTLLKKAVTIADTIPDVWLQIAKAYGKLKKPNEELDAYKKYVVLDPENYDVNIRIGTLLMDKNELNEGIKYLNNAYKVAPNSIKTIIILSDGYIRANRLNEALSLLESAKINHKDNVEIQKKLVDVFVLMGRDKELLAEIEKLLTKKRDNSTLLMYAQLLIKSGKIDDAKNAAEDILATDPENIEALMILASIYKGKKQYIEANDIYTEITLIDNKYAAAFYERGNLYLIQSKPLWAQKYYKKTMTIEPNHALSRLGLAKVALLHKDKNKYKKFVEKAYSLDPSNDLIKKEYAKLK